MMLNTQGGNVENRWSDRRGLILGVDVFKQGTKVATCRSRDIGLGGTFLQLTEDHSLSKDLDVQLVFHLFSGHQETKHTLHARVVRLSNDGVGLRFNEFDTGVFRSLQEIMSYRGSELVH